MRPHPEPAHPCRLRRPGAARPAPVGHLRTADPPPDRPGCGCDRRRDCGSGRLRRPIPCLSPRPGRHPRRHKSR
ncbi:hypothetical protein CVH10_16850, partial [Halomonas sp. ND22Bw]